MTDQPMMTLVIEVPAISTACEGENDKFATKFGQIAQGVLFAASAGEFGMQQADIEKMYSTSRGTISTNKKMVEGAGVRWGVVQGQQLSSLLGGDATGPQDTLSDETQSVVASLQEATAGPETNVVEAQFGQQLDPNATQQVMEQVSSGAVIGGSVPGAAQQVQAEPEQAQAREPAAPQQPQMQQPPYQPGMPPPQAARFDVTTVDPMLSQHMHTAPHPQGDPANGIIQNEVLYWQPNQAAPQGGQWLTRALAYQAFGMTPPEASMPAPQMMGQPQPQQSGPGQFQLGQPVGPQGSIQQV